MHECCRQASVVVGGFRSEPVGGLTAVVPIVLISVGEEFGWRGFALRRLLPAMSPLKASIIVGCAWAAWHIPASLIGTGVPLNTPFPLFAMWVVCASVLMTAVFQASGNSAWSGVIMHTSANAAFVFLPLLPEHTGTLRVFAIFVLLMIGAAGWFILQYNMHTVVHDERTTPAVAHITRADTKRPRG